MAIEQWGLISVPHLMWHGASVYIGHLRGPVTRTFLGLKFAATGNSWVYELQIYKFMYICFFVIGIVSNFCSSQSSADGKAIMFISYPFTMKSSHFNFHITFTCHFNIIFKHLKKVIVILILIQFLIFLNLIIICHVNCTVSNTWIL